MAAAIGLRAYTGWGVAVTLGGDVERPFVADRRRFVLQAPELPTEVYHAAHGLAPGNVTLFIAEALASAEACATTALNQLLADLDRPVNCVGLVSGRRPPGPPPAHARLAHTGMHGAEGEMYRYVLLRAAEKAGLRVTAVPEPELLDLGCATLRLAAPDLSERLIRMGAALGPPWTQREKTAALAGWLALARV